jgi:hypothetical protein
MSLSEMKSNNFVHRYSSCRKFLSKIWLKLPGFSWYNIPKWEKYAKLPKIYKNGRKIYQINKNIPNGHMIYQHLTLQDPPKFTQVGIFCLKIYHLATLV